MLKSHVIGKWAIGLILLVTASSSSAYTPINTYPAWNGTQYISSFGVPNTATYGQIVTAPPLETRLNSFSFWIGYPGATITFRGEVYAWNGTMATGPALYESAPVSIGQHQCIPTVYVHDPRWRAGDPRTTVRAFRDDVERSSGCS